VDLGFVRLGLGQDGAGLVDPAAGVKEVDQVL